MAHDSTTNVRSLRSQVTQGVKWHAISTIGRQLLSVAIFSTLSRLLSTKDFGLAGLVYVYLSFIGLFATQGIGTALIQRKTLTPDHLHTAFWLNIICAGLLCAGTAIFANPLCVLLGEPNLAPMLRWSSLSLIFSASSTVHGALLTRNMDFRRPAIRTIAANITGGGVGVGMALANCGVWSLVGQHLTASLIGTISLLCMSYYTPKWHFSLIKLRELSAVSFSVFGTSLLWFVSSRLDQLIIGRFAGVSALGLYIIAGKIPELVKLVTYEPLGAVSLPALSQLKDNTIHMCEVIYKGMELNALVSFPAFVGLAVVAQDAIPVLFGGKWSDAAPICSLLSLYSLVNVLQIFFYTALVASGGAGKSFFLNIFHAFGTLAACVFGIWHGTSLLVVALILNSIVLAVPSLLFLQRRIGLSPLRYCKPCIAPAFSSIVMGISICLIRNLLPAHIIPLSKLLLDICVGVAVYVGCMFVLNRKVLKSAIDIAKHALSFHPKTATAT